MFLGLQAEFLGEFLTVIELVQPPLLLFLQLASRSLVVDAKSEPTRTMEPCEAVSGFLESRSSNHLDFLGFRTDTPWDGVIVVLELPKQVLDFTAELDALTHSLSLAIACVAVEGLRFWPLRICPVFDQRPRLEGADHLICFEFELHTSTSLPLLGHICTLIHGVPHSWCPLRQTFA